MKAAKGSVVDEKTGRMYLHQDTVLHKDIKTINPRSSQVRATTGANKLLVVRVNVAGGSQSPPYSTGTLSDKWFGTSGDAIHNNSQYQACSFGKISFDPYIGTTSSGVNISDGSYEITVSASYNGSDSAIESEARSVLAAELGNLSQFDYVALSVPANSQQYAAYAYVNSWLSLYQGSYVTDVTVQMHEIGHNIGLAHSGEGSQSYGDTSGLMGALWDDDRNICFNGAKNGAQLGWYDDRIVDVSTSGYDGLIYGIADYGTTTATEKMLLKMSVGSTDYWISYNKATGVNSQPGEGANTVMVHSRPGGSGYAESSLLAKLSPGQSYTGSSTDVTFVSVNGDAAYVVIGEAPPTPAPDCVDIAGWTDAYGDGCEWYETYDQPGCPSYGDMWANPTTDVTPNQACCYCDGGVPNGSPVAAPTTAAPVATPTSTAPSATPVGQPTASPIASPTSAPSASPIEGSVECPDLPTKSECNNVEGCSWRKVRGSPKACYDALDTQTCSKWDGKKRKCKKKGCLFSDALCTGRWN